MKVLFLITYLLSAFCCHPKAVVLRCDDIRLNFDSQNIAMFKLFEKYNVHFTCAVIPFDGNGNRVEYDENILNYLKSLQKRGIVEIALHGYSHIWTGTHGELDGLPYSEQYVKIKAGKQYLDSIFETNIASFVPPRNYYDTTTIKVLEEQNFKNLSAGTDVNVPLVQSSLNYIPFSCGELRLICNELRSSWGGVIVLMFHPFEFNDEYTLASFEKDLQYVSSNNINTMTLTEASEAYTFDVKRIKFNKEHNLLTNLFPSIKQWSYTYSPLYISLVWLLNFILYLIPFIVSAVFCGKKRLWIVISYALIFMVVVYTVANHIRPLLVWCITALICFCIAIINRFFVERIQSKR